MSIKAQLFVTCLADQFFPDTLKRMVLLLERLGVQVEFPRDQTCCGQPFFNTGFRTPAAAMAKRWIDLYAATDGYIVSPSGSCVEMIRGHYLDLFKAASPERAKAQAVIARTFELTQFLVDVLKVTDVGARYPHKATYHACCHTARGLGIREQPLALLRAVQGLELVPLNDADTCCGFGGAFSVIYPEISRAMMQAKIENINASGAEAVVALDPGCLMNIGGGLVKTGSRVKALHLLDVLVPEEVRE
jgi:L-lactate dehydrogenase complex protein LldE